MAKIAPIHPAITGTEAWTVPNVIGAEVLFALAVGLIVFAMSRSAGK
ncbi:MAG: hypothetical protein WD184_01315 [Acidimicrobiia bacterium]